MKITINTKGKTINMEVNEAVDKLLSSGKNEIKNSINYTPNYLAKQILTNENIDAEFINSKFKKYHRSSKYMLLRYCFDKLSEENRYLGILDLEINKFRYSHADLSKSELVNAIGEDNYNKYYLVVDFIKNVNMDYIKTFSKENINILKNFFRVLSVSHYYRYLDFMQTFNFKIDVSIFDLYYTAKDHSSIVYKYISSMNTNKKIKLFKNLLRYPDYRKGFINFFNNNNDNSFNEFLALNNM